MRSAGLRSYVCINRDKPCLRGNCTCKTAETRIAYELLLGAGVLSVVALFPIVCSVFVRWLGSSFVFFCLVLRWQKM